MTLSSEEQKWLKKWYMERSAKANKICKILRFFSKNDILNPIILDIGCYEGGMVEKFSNHTENFVIGIDISYNAIKNASLNAKKQNAKNVEFIQADATAFPIRNNKVDWIVYNQVIDYLESKEKVIEEAERILNYQGIVYLSVMSFPFLKLYKVFTILFARYLGPFYGRSSPSLDSPYGSPKGYKYCKSKILSGRKFGINDIPPDLIYENNFERTNKNISGIKKKITNVIYRLIREWSPTWVFVLYRK